MSEIRVEKISSVNLRIYRTKNEPSSKTTTKAITAIQKPIQTRNDRNSRPEDLEN